MEVNKETALSVYAQIEAQDEVIAAASGSAEAGKRAIANQVATETEKVHGKSVSTLVSGLEKLEGRELVGAVTAIQKVLKETFGETVNTWLDTQVEERKNDTPAVTPEQLTSALEARKVLVTQYNAMKELLEALTGEDVSAFPVPKRMTGPRGPQGKRGPRLPKNMQLSIDGKNRTATQNSLSSIANTVCKGEEFGEEGWNVKDLRNFMTEQGYNFEEPSDFTFTLPNGKIFAGYLTEDAPEDEEEDEEVEVIEE